jgi:adenylate kinase
LPASGACAVCGGTRFTRRADDNAESLRTRLLAYYKQTSPLIGYYHAKGILTAVDGLKDIPEVEAEIARALEGAVPAPA